MNMDSSCGQDSEITSVYWTGSSNVSITRETLPSSHPLVGYQRKVRADNLNFL